MDGAWSALGGLRIRFIFNGIQRSVWAPKGEWPSGSFASYDQTNPGRDTNPCYTLSNRRIRSEVLACSGYRLLANFHIAFAVIQ
jgi:hypothetical protein